MTAEMISYLYALRKIESNGIYGIAHKKSMMKIHNTNTEWVAKFKHLKAQW
jgi:hypothetical protein